MTTKKAVTKLCAHMQFTISRDELHDALMLAKGIVERRTTIPILNNVLIYATRHGAMIAATDQEISVQRKCTATVTVAGSTTVGARALLDIVKGVPDGPVQLRLEDEHWLEVSAGAARFRVTCLDPAESPAMPVAPTDTPALQISSETLRDMLTSVLFAVSVDETRVNLNGVHLEAVKKKGKLCMTATDGHRLATVTRRVDQIALATPITIQRKAAVELLKLVKQKVSRPVVIRVKAQVAYIERGPVEHAPDRMRIPRLRAGDPLEDGANRHGRDGAPARLAHAAVRRGQ